MKKSDLIDVTNTFLERASTVSVSEETVVRVLIGLENRADRHKIYALQRDIIKKYPDTQFDFTTSYGR